MGQVAVYGFCILAALILAAMLVRFRSMTKAWEKQRKGMENTLQDTKEFHDILLIDLKCLLQEQEEISLHLAKAFPQMTETADEISGRIRELTAFREGELSDVEHEMQTIRRETGNLAQSAADTAGKAQEAKNCSQSVNDAYKEFLEKHARRREAAEQAQSQANQLDGLLAELPAMFMRLLDLAEQIELLSLNANIEAAKGEGQENGLPVIALEMRKLTEESRELSDAFAERGKVLDAFQRKNKDCMDQMIRLQEEEQVKLTKTGLLLDQMDRETRKAHQAAGGILSCLEEVEAAEEKTRGLLELLTDAKEQDQKERTALEDLQDTMAKAEKDCGMLKRITEEMQSRITN